MGHKRKVLADHDAKLAALSITDGTELLLLVEKPGFEVHVKGYPGYPGVRTWSTLPLLIDTSTTVADMKTMIQDARGVPSVNQRLIIVGRELKADELLSDRGIQEASVVHIVIKQEDPRR